MKKIKFRIPEDNNNFEELEGYLFKYNNIDYVVYYFKYNEKWRSREFTTGMIFCCEGKTIKRCCEETEKFIERNYYYCLEELASQVIVNKDKKECLL